MTANSEVVYGCLVQALSTNAALAVLDRAERSRVHCAISSDLRCAWDASMMRRPELSCRFKVVRFDLLFASIQGYDTCGSKWFPIDSDVMVNIRRIARA
jgi:hypothetical protein